MAYVDSEMNEWWGAGGMNHHGFLLFFQSGRRGVQAADEEIGSLNNLRGVCLFKTLTAWHMGFYCIETPVLFLPSSWYPFSFFLRSTRP